MTELVAGSCFKKKEGRMYLCESCSSTNVSFEKIKPSLSYWSCRECGHCLIDFTSGLETKFESAQKGYYGAESLLLRESPAIFEREILAARERLVRRYIRPSSNVVEVGPGSGFFAALLRERGHQVELFEHGAELAAALSEKLHVPTHVGEFESADFSLAAADVFCSFHVIEHVKDPIKHLSAGYRAVRPGGVALIATPNARSWQQRLLIRLSPNFSSAHLRVFSKASLKRYAESAGWIVETDFTQEYTSEWLRVLSKALRKLKKENEETTAGKYSKPSLKMSAVYILAFIFSWPLRQLQASLGGGSEINLVLRRPEKDIPQ